MNYKTVYLLLCMLVSASTQAAEEKAKPANNLVESIIKLYPQETIRAQKNQGKSTALPREIGFIQQFPNGSIVIQLRGLSQDTNMGCGFSTYANARILQMATNHTQLLKDLNDTNIIHFYLQELGKSLAARGITTQKITQLKTSCGLAMDEFFGPNTAVFNNLFLGAQGSRKGELGHVDYHLFPTANTIKTWKHNFDELAYTIEQYSFANRQIRRKLPIAGIVNIGTTGGHYIAVRFEHYNGNYHIIFVDSIQFEEPAMTPKELKEFEQKGTYTVTHRPAIFSDKIEAYKKEFSLWFQEMPNYLKPLSSAQKPLPTTTTTTTTTKSKPIASHLEVKPTTKLSASAVYRRKYGAPVQYDEALSKSHTPQIALPTEKTTSTAAKIIPIPTTTTTTSTVSSNKDIIKLLLKDLLQGVVCGTPTTQLEKLLGKIQKLDQQFIKIKPLVLTPNKNRNNDNRIKFFVDLNKIDPLTSEAVFELIDDPLLQKDNEAINLIQRMINTL